MPGEKSQIPEKMDKKPKQVYTYLWVGNYCPNHEYRSAISIMVSLKDEEALLVDKIKVFLESGNAEEGNLIRKTFASLSELAKVINEYPSVRDSGMLRGVIRNEQQLLSSLCSFASNSHLLRIPTRVVLFRSFLVAKFHSFSLLFLLTKENPEFKAPLRRTIFSILHTLMMEEVYFSCLDDSEFSQDIKIQVADDLITLWDSGIDLRSVRHLPALEMLWTARDSSPPAFGTMNGSSELLRITIDMEQDWQEFLVEESSHDDTRWALEEFLFGLSYEEIISVRARLNQFGIAAVNHDEVRTYLNSKPAFSIASANDFRAIYDFYVERRDAANFRKKITVPGPKRTIEEIYLKYRIARE